MSDITADLILAALGLLVLAIVGYAFYSAALDQMARNAKNKRVLKNTVTHWTGREYRKRP